MTRWFTTEQAMRVADASYRQVDYWLRQGLVDAARPMPGSGFARTLNEQDLLRIALLAELSRAGIGPMRLPRDANLGELERTGRTDLTPGLSLVLDPHWTQQTTTRIEALNDEQ